VGTAGDESTRIRFASGDVAPAVGIVTVRPERRAARPVVTAPARIEHDPAWSASVNPRARGVVRAVHVTVGTRVSAGDPLVTIESATISADQSRLQAARKRASVARAAVTRQKRLANAGVLAVKDLQASEQELAAAEAEVQALSASTGLVDRTTARSYDLTAPIAGTVVERSVTMGQLVDTEHAVLRIVDTSVLFAVIDVPEADIGRVAVGQAVSLTVEVLPGRTWRGKIAYLAPEVDVRTRTVATRVQLANPDGALRANMLAVATVEVGAARPVLLVPRSALQRVRGWMVFQRLAADRFEGKSVKIEDSDADPVAVLSGLEERADVVTTGSFLLKTEVLKESIGAGCCEADAKK
jgi:cobalt-zinc-cadmium efflux system membrane fusion protein